MTDTIEDAVKNNVAKVAKCDVESVTDDSLISQDLKMRSINRIELAALLESTCGVPVKNREILQVKTVGDVINLIRKKKQS